MNVNDMGKTELRAACKAAGISYSKLNNDGMRAALTELSATKATVEKAEADRHTGSGIKIEKDRETRNGITRPSIGGKCRSIWDALDAYQAETGELPTSKTVRALAADEGWNLNNASIEFYQWRKFNGITGRAK